MREHPLKSRPSMLRAVDVVTEERCSVCRSTKVTANILLRNSKAGRERFWHIDRLQTVWSQHRLRFPSVPQFTCAVEILELQLFGVRHFIATDELSKTLLFFLRRCTRTAYLLREQWNLPADDTHLQALLRKHACLCAPCFLLSAVVLAPNRLSRIWTAAGLCWKAARVGERLSPYVSVALLLMAGHVLFVA